MNLANLFFSIGLKHLSGQHNQKRHGWRYGNYGKAVRSLRSTPTREDQSAYRKRANLPGQAELQATKKPYVAPPKPVKDKEFKKFDGEADATKSFNKKKAWRDWAKGLSDDEIGAIRRYTDGYYGEINGQLRNGYAPANYLHTEHIDSALARGKLHENMMLYRGLKSQELHDAKGMKVGGTITDKGYGSTTAKESTGASYGNAANGVILRIKAPKGLAGGFMNLPDKNGSNLSEYPFETEFIMPRGQKYRIDGISKDYNGNTVYDVTAIRSRK